VTAEEQAPEPRGELAEAEATEAALRAQVGELVSARVRAQREAARLAERGRLPGAHGSLTRLAERYRDQARRLTDEVEVARRSLREQEARVEALRAAAGDVPG
jgi:hypothetical protein